MIFNPDNPEDNFDTCKEPEYPPSCMRSKRDCPKMGNIHDLYKLSHYIHANMLT